MRIAEVIVDITNSQVDKIFDYEIDEWGKVGMRVFVPFGNRIIQGFVINIKDNTTVEKSKLKKVIGFVEDYVVIKEELIRLMHFMVKKYHPDVNAGDKDCEEKFKKIAIAYRELTAKLADNN